MNITTEYRNVNGTGKVTAKTTGGSPDWLDGSYSPQQKTILYRQDRTSAQNHGAAAGLLLRKMGVHEVYPDVPVSHDSNESGTKHKFTL